MREIEGDAKAAYARLPGHNFRLEVPPHDGADQALIRKESVALIAEDRTSVAVGFLLARPVDGHAHIVAISVRDAHEGLGYRRALLSTLEAWARLQEFNESTLTTFAKVAQNAPFYEQLGYRSFTPGADRPGLLEIRAKEIAAGFDPAFRVAMRKRLS